MRSNLEYMAKVPEQFAGEAAAQESSDKLAWQKDAEWGLDWMIRTIMGSNALGLSSIIAYGKAQQDPFAFFYGASASESGPETVGLMARIQDMMLDYGYNEQQWADFKKTVADNLSTLDESLTETYMDRDDKWAELEPEDFSSLDPETDSWMDYGFDKCVSELEEYTQSLKGEWTGHNFVPAPERTVGSMPWGFYNEAETEHYHRALMRMGVFRNTFRVGSVSIDEQYVVQCHVSGCDWKRSLRYNAVGGEAFERRYAEFQVLSILQHLGEHTRRNPENYWTPINEVKRGRDTATAKLDAASEVVVEKRSSTQPCRVVIGTSATYLQLKAEAQA